MIKIEWASMPEKGQVAALEEFFVRVDELNRHAGSLTRQEVASRLLDLNEDLFEAFMVGGETPGTLGIRTALEAEPSGTRRLHTGVVVRERPFTEEAPEETSGAEDSGGFVASRHLREQQS